jgi:hypothetical protein
MPIRNKWGTETPIKILAAGIGFIILFSCLCGCGAPPGLEGVKKSEFDLTERFSVVSPRTDPEAREFYAHFPVTRKGNRKDSIVMIAPTAVHASLAGFSGPVELKGSATPVFNVGDGIRMDIFLRENGTNKLIYNRFFDAGRRAEDRDWIPLSVPLELRGSADNWLEIRISGGPQGDQTADWLALNAMSIVPRK